MQQVVSEEEEEEEDADEEEEEHEMVDQNRGMPEDAQIHPRVIVAARPVTGRVKK